MEHKIIGIQFNSRVGDLLGNSTHMAKEILRHENARVPTILVFPEMALSGYPLQDLVRVHQFSDDARTVLENYLAPLCLGNAAALIGFPLRSGKRIYNAVAFCAEGKVQHIFTKTELPNNSVFDEVRTYTRGKPSVFTWKGLCFGVPICEDVWHKRVCMAMKREGAQILLSPNASPYDHGKWSRRSEVLGKRVAQTGLPLLYVNRWGGQDELVFDGQSALIKADGTVTRAAMYEDAKIIFYFDGKSVEEIFNSNPFQQVGWGEEAWKHHVLGLKDYVGRHNKGKAVIGLSGGVDSALVLILAVAALGAENVTAIGMPYGPYSSAGSVTDARALAESLGVAFFLKPIDPIIKADREILMNGDGAFTPEGITEENLQARARGRLLMTFSNAGYGMVLTTGNKSEMSVGYSTLYGDMNGGYNPIKDLYKTEVFKLCRWYAENTGTISTWATAEALLRIVNKPPSAELRADQKDTDSLPPYDILDAILEQIIEKMKTPAEIKLKGVAPEVVTKVYNLVRGAEFKRRQAPPGTRWHNGDLDKDYRMPLDNGYRTGAVNDRTFAPLLALRNSMAA